MKLAGNLVTILVVTVYPTEPMQDAQESVWVYESVAEAEAHEAVITKLAEEGRIEEGRSVRIRLYRSFAIRDKAPSDPMKAPGIPRTSDGEVIN